jgi:hypothetical protein
VDIKGSGSYHEFGNAIGSVSNDGNWNARLNLAGSSHAKLDVKSVSDGIITSIYSHTGQNRGFVGTLSNHKLGLAANGTAHWYVETDGKLRHNDVSTVGMGDGGIRAKGAIDSADVSIGAFRVYDGSTFRGGFGTSRWALGSGYDVDDMCMYSVGDKAFITINDGTVGLQLTSSGISAEVGGFLINGTTVIDSSRNLTNMGAGSFSSYVSMNELRANSYMLQDGVKEIALGTFNFSNSDPNNFIDIIFTAGSFWGTVEVEITSSYSYQNACGSLVKRFAVGHNSGSTSYGEGSEELISDTGPLSNSIRIGSITRKGTTFVVPINKFTSTNNNFEVRVKLFSNGYSDSTTVTLGSKYSGTNLAREYVPFRHITGQASNTVISSTIDGTGRLRVSGGNNTDGNAQTSTGAVIGTYVDQYAFIDLASSHANGSWIDFSYADGGDYKGRIRYVNSTGIFEFHANGSSSANMSLGTSYMEMYGGIRADEYRINSTTVIDSSRNLIGAKGTFTGTGTGGAPTLDIINSSATTFNHSVEVMTPNMTSGQHNIVVIGRESNTKNAGYIGYLYSSAGSNNNKITLGHWGNDDLVTIDGLGNTNINEGALQIGGTTVIDSSRNLTNIRYITAERLYLGDGNDGFFYNDTNGRTAFAGGDFYIQNSVTNYYNYATNQYHGNSSGDNHYFRGNALSGTNWSINTSGAATFNGATINDNLDINTNTENAIDIYESSGLSGFTYMRFLNTTGSTMYGRIYRSYSSLVYSTSSDYRLKENVVDLTNAADRINLIPVRRFNFIEHPDRTVDGFLAHEVQAIVPEAIIGEKDEVDDTGAPVYQGIDQSKLVPLLTAALQEALQEIENLKQETQSLIDRVTNLENN